MQGIGNINKVSEMLSKQMINEPIKNKETKTNFSDVVKSFINDVNNSQIDANNKVKSLINGEDVTMHEVMLANQESQISLQLMIELRNKIYEAYQEVNKVQL